MFQRKRSFSSRGSRGGYSRGGYRKTFHRGGTRPLRGYRLSRGGIRL